MHMNTCVCVCVWEREGDGRECSSVGFLSATVQTESTADGDAAVFIPHIQPQLTSAYLHAVDGKIRMSGSVRASLKSKPLPRLTSLSGTIILIVSAAQTECLIFGRTNKAVGHAVAGDTNSEL